MRIPGDSLRFLRLFLGRHEPIVMDEALKLWNRQREAITRAQIEYAVANKEVPVEWMLAWQDDYADFVNNTLDPEWREAFRDAGEKMAEEGITPAVGEPFFFTPTGRRIDEWIQTRGGELITNLTVQQREAVRAIIRHYTVEAPSSPDELARVLRPVIGLTKRQAVAVQKLEEALIAEGLPRSVIQKQVNNYAEKLLRYRSESIARTELSFAWNQGQHESVAQASEKGYLPDTSRIRKVWITAEDEMVCDICAPLNGVTVGFEEIFSFRNERNEIQEVSFLCPAHVRCRCSIGYDVEV